MSTDKKIEKGMVAAVLVVSMVLIPLAASAHYIYTNTSNVAAVAADGHDHDHGPVLDEPGDGHTDHSHSSGASALLIAGSPEWWGLLFVALLAASGLSYIMWRFVQVPQKRKSDIGGEK